MVDQTAKHYPKRILQCGHYANYEKGKHGMNRNEYVEWLRHATAAYPEVGRQFDGDDEGERSAIWEKALFGVPLAVAIECIDAMVVGHTERPKFGWSDLPKYVNDYRRERANQELHQRDYGVQRDDQQCPKCHGLQSGVVAIWNPWFVDDCYDKLHLCNDVQEAYTLWRSWRKINGRRGDAQRLTVLCDCQHPTAVARRAKLQDFKDGRLKKDESLPGIRQVYIDRFVLWMTGHPSEVLNHFSSDVSSEPAGLLEDQRF